MSFLNSVLKVFVGDKSKKDIKGIQPIVNRIKELESDFEALSLDELRAKTTTFKNKIQEALKEVNQQIEELNAEADATEDITRKEDIYAEIDSLKVSAYEISEGVLNEILPEAFATIKETANLKLLPQPLTVKFPQRKITLIWRAIMPFGITPGMRQVNP
jgi:preprotein translocase subunit SecA